MCGENCHLTRLVAQATGSSPRVRGKPTEADYLELVGGLIPACAGKTDRQTRCRATCWAHPRVCGENRGRRRDLFAAAGSSPRVRGKLRLVSHVGGARRLIPACAGKTLASLAAQGCKGAHPRVCGENARLRSRWVRPPGSSPRVRGKLNREMYGDIILGLIPACAGKTTGFRADRPAAWAHPRVCGENCWAGGIATMMRGSSPRVRGKH